MRYRIFFTFIFLIIHKLHLGKKEREERERKEEKENINK